MLAELTLHGGNTTISSVEVLVCERKMYLNSKMLFSSSVDRKGISTEPPKLLQLIIKKYIPARV